MILFPQTLSAIISSIFKSSAVKGLVYLPFDLLSGYQESTGVTALYAPGQGIIDPPVGLRLDKSRGLALGPELVTNGDFTTNTDGWTASALSGGAASTLSVVADRMRVTNTGTTYGTALQQIATVVGKTYRVRADLFSSAPGISANVRVGSTAAGLEYGSLDAVGTSNIGAGFHFVATGTVAHITLLTQNVLNASSDYDNISVREIPGLHSLQATSASRPALSRRYNPLVGTENILDAAWTKSNTVAITGAKIAAAATSAVHAIFQAAYSAAVIGLTYTHTLELKAAEYGWAIAMVQLNGTSYGRYINLATGALGGNYINAPSAISVPVLTADGYWKVSISAVATGVNPVYSSVYLVTADTGSPAFLGDGVSGIFLRKMQVDIGPVAPYQSITNISTYDASVSPIFERFDGLDDGYGLTFAAGTLPGDTDAFYAVRRLSSGKFVIGHASIAGSFIAYGDSADAVALACSGVGTPTYWVNGTAVAGGAATTRAQLAAAIPVGQWVILEIRNLDLSLWAGYRFGDYTGALFNGANAGEWLCPAQTDAMRRKIRQRMSIECTQGQAVVV